VGEGEGVGVAVGVGVALGLGVGVGVGVPDAATEKLSDEAKANPLASQARTVSACFPAGSDTAAVSVAALLLAFSTESTYMIMAVTACTVSRAAAENCTGEAAVPPLAGEQIFTVRSVVAEQLCAHAAWVVPAINNNKRAGKNVFKNFTGETSPELKLFYGGRIQRLRSLLQR